MMQQPGSGMTPQQAAAMGMQYQQPNPYAMMGQAPPPQQQQQPMWAPHHFLQPQPGQAQMSAASADEVRTLWIGDLHYWMEETYISSCFAAHAHEIANVKVIRNKLTGNSEGYGFVEFTSHAAAERVLQTYNGTLMPNVEQTFRLNWASYGGGEKCDDGPDYTIFVGDLAADVTDQVQQDTFKVHYPSVKVAKVVLDRVTQRTKGYGFVRFSDVGEQMRAMNEMNGQYCSSRPMRNGQATNKKPLGTKASEQRPHGQTDQDPCCVILQKAQETLRLERREENFMKHSRGTSKSAYKRRMQRFGLCAKCGKCEHEGACSKNSTISQNELTTLLRGDPIKLKAEEAARRGSSAWYAINKLCDLRTSKLHL